MKTTQSSKKTMAGPESSKPSVEQRSTRASETAENRAEAHNGLEALKRAFLEAKRDNEIDEKESATLAQMATPEVRSAMNAQLQGRERARAGFDFKVGGITQAVRALIAGLMTLTAVPAYADGVKTEKRVEQVQKRIDLSQYYEVSPYFKGEDPHLALTDFSVVPYEEMVKALDYSKGRFAIQVTTNDGINQIHFLNRYGAFYKIRLEPFDQAHFMSVIFDAANKVWGYPYRYSHFDPTERGIVKLEPKKKQEQQKRVEVKNVEVKREVGIDGKLDEMRSILKVKPDAEYKNLSKLVDDSVRLIAEEVKVKIERGEAYDEVNFIKAKQVEHLLRENGFVKEADEVNEKLGRISEAVKLAETMRNLKFEFSVTGLNDTMTEDDLKKSGERLSEIVKIYERNVDQVSSNFSLKDNENVDETIRILNGVVDIMLGKKESKNTEKLVKNTNGYRNKMENKFQLMLNDVSNTCSTTLLVSK